MSYQRYKEALFGKGQTGLTGTVGYALYNADGTLNTARTTSGITERGTGTGTYGATITLPATFTGEIRWDTGGGSPVYASEAINPGEWEYQDAAITSRESAASFGTDVQSALTAQGYTATRAGYLDTLNGLVQAVWDKATTALTTVGSIGKRLADDIDATISSRNATPPPTVSAIAGAVWGDTATYGAGSKGAELAAAGLSGDPLSATVPGSYANGTAGYVLGHIDPAQVTIAPAPLMGTLGTGTLTLWAGDAYQVERGTAISATLNALAPDLSAASSVTLQFGTPGTTPVLSVAGTVSGPRSAQVVTWELTSAQSATLLPTSANGGPVTWRFAVVAAWADSDADRVTVIEGTAWVRALV